MNFPVLLISKQCWNVVSRFGVSTSTLCLSLFRVRRKGWRKIHWLAKMWIVTWLGWRMANKVEASYSSKVFNPSCIHSRRVRLRASISFALKFVGKNAKIERERDIQAMNPRAASGNGALSQAETKRPRYSRLTAWMLVCLSWSLDRSLSAYAFVLTLVPEGFRAKGS